MGPGSGQVHQRPWIPPPGKGCKQDRLEHRKGLPCCWQQPIPQRQGEVATTVTKGVLRRVRKAILRSDMRLHYSSGRRRETYGAQAVRPEMGTLPCPLTGTTRRRFHRAPGGSLPADVAQSWLQILPTVPPGGRGASLHMATGVSWTPMPQPSDPLRPPSFEWVPLSPPGGRRSAEWRPGEGDRGLRAQGASWVPPSMGLSCGFRISPPLFHVAADVLLPGGALLFLRGNPDLL